MSTINYTYNVIVDRFRQFAEGHFQLRRFTHGEISQADLEKEAEWPWLHVKPRAINYAPGTRSFSFEIFISDLPRDKEDKTGYQAESITDCSLIFQDLINEIYLGNMFGDQVVLSRPVNSEPFVEQYTHTLTGVTGIVELNLDYDWSACSIPASWNYNTPTDSPSDGWGALQFIESLDQNGVFVSLLNDEETPGNSYYYGTDASGVKGWYAIVDNIGLTCETLPDCAVIISIEDDIAALQTDVALKANTADLGATAFSNSYNDLDDKPSIPSIAGLATVTYVDQQDALKVDKVAGKGLSTEDYTTAEKTKLAGIQDGAEVNVNADWNAVSGDAQILNKPTIPSIAGLVPETRTLTINGTTQDLSANRTFTIATGLTVGTTPITSGAVGRVLFEGTGNVLQQSGNLFWDNTNSRLGIGTATPAYSISHLGSIGVASFFSQRDFGAGNFTQITQRSSYIAYTTDGSCGISIGTTSGSGRIQAFVNLPATASSFLSLQPLGGNVVIGTTTDAGYKLDVNGTARVSGALTANTLTLIGNTLFIASATVGGLFATRYTNSVSYSGGHIFTNSTTNISATSGDNFTLQSIQVFAPTSGTATYGALAIAPTINQTGGANGITRGLYVNPTLTSAADFRAIETTAGNVLFGASGTGFYWDNTNSRLGIKRTPAVELDVSGDIRSSGYVFSQITQTNTIQTNGSNLSVKGTGGTNYITMFQATGNVLIQNGGTTTDAGYKLDVNGTARVQGNITGTGTVTITGAFSTQSLSLHPSSGYATFSGGVTLPISGATFTSASGTHIGLRYTSTFSPTSGTAIYSGFSIVNTINQTGGANGITRGLYINPTLTAASDFRAIEVTEGTTVLAPSVTARASLRIPSGTAPTSPVNGDIWFDGTDIKMRIGGVTKTFTLI